LEAFQGIAGGGFQFVEWLSRLPTDLFELFADVGEAYRTFSGSFEVFRWFDRVGLGIGLWTPECRGGCFSPRGPLGVTDGKLQSFERDDGFGLQNHAADWPPGGGDTQLWGGIEGGLGGAKLVFVLVGQWTRERNGFGSGKPSARVAGVYREGARPGEPSGPAAGPSPRNRGERCGGRFGL